MKTDLTEIKQRLLELYHYAKEQNLVTFLIFLGISAFFWVLMALNDELQRDFSVPVVIDDVPEDVTLLNTDPITVNLSLRDKGRTLIRYEWGEPPTIRFRFQDIRKSSHRLEVSPQRLNHTLRDLFGQATVMSLKPDSISIPFTRQPGKLVHVSAKTGDISPESHYVVSGPVTVLDDTVRLYSISRIPGSIKVLSTQPVHATDISDTTIVEVKVAVPDGMRAIPSTVKVRIPVEPLISRKQTVAIKTINVPPGRSVITFPTQVEVNYLVPMSIYQKEKDDPQLTVVADYRRRSTSTSRIPVILRNIPDGYQSVELQADSVEFLIEQH